MPETFIEKFSITLPELWHNHVMRVLRRYKGHATAACKALGIGRSTLYRYIEKQGINLEKIRREAEDDRQDD